MYVVTESFNATCVISLEMQNCSGEGSLNILVMYLHSNCSLFSLFGSDQVELAAGDQNLLVDRKIMEVPFS